MAHDRSDAQLREAVIRLAHAKPEFRPLLVPLVRKRARAAGSNDQAKHRKWIQDLGKALSKATNRKVETKAGRVSETEAVIQYGFQVLLGDAHPGHSIGFNYGFGGGFELSLSVRTDKPGPPGAGHTSFTLEYTGGKSGTWYDSPPPIPRLVKLILKQRTIVAPKDPIPTVSLDDVREAVRELRTYLEEGRRPSPTTLTYQTREYGSVAAETPSEYDIDEAERVAEALVRRFGRGVVVPEIDLVDEWVHLDIKIKAK